MPVDLAMDQIHGIFFEESFEGIDVMESGLLSLTPGETQPEVINDIFRAAHSIKGGAATFGFVDVSNFTHGVETLLDEMRSGDREVTEDAIEVLLSAVDCIRDMLEALQNKEAIDSSRNAEIQQKLDELLAESEGEAAPEAEAAAGEMVLTTSAPEPTAAAADTAPAASAPPAPVSGSGQGGGDSQGKSGGDEGGSHTWHIVFKPHADLLQSGNDPARIFRALEELGELSVNSDISGLPTVQELNPEECHISWDMHLTTEASEAEIRETFDWVVDQCDLTIERETTELETTPAPAATEAPAAQVPAAPQPEPETPATAQAPEAKEDRKTSGKAASKDSGSIRVSIDKIDSLLNLVGELVITQSMLARFGDDSVAGGDNSKLKDGLMVLERHTRELQESAMQMRMLPISVSFSRFRRLVRDMSTKLGKKVDLVLSGENTELDKTVLEKISDPLVHLVRNSLDHGIEMPDVRKAAGKPEAGKLQLSAYHEGGNIVIQVEDDGAGLNKDKILAKAVERGLVSPSEQLTDDQIYNLIFQPGFSTADQVSDLSGRGVGMDVVRRNIADLGGRIEIHSEMGMGSVLKIRLPLTLAILDGQLVRVGDDVYIFSLLSMVETVLVPKSEVNRVVGSGNVYRLRNEYIPVIRLRELFNLKESESPVENELLVVVESDGNRIGVFVDDLMDQQQVVIKSLEENYKSVEGLAGATILGDGEVALIIDVPGLIERLRHIDPSQIKDYKEYHAA